MPETLRPVPASFGRNWANPPKGMLVNLATNERFRFPFNPTYLEETIQANFVRMSVPGLSHERLSYSGTSNKTIPLELFLSQLGIDTKRGEAGSPPYVATTIKNFLESLVYPQGGQDGIDGVTHGTPRVLFIWPRMISMVARVTKIQFLHRSFSSRTGATAVLVANLTLEEDRDSRLLMDEVRERGGQHYQGAVPSEGSEIAVGGEGS